MKHLILATILLLFGCTRKDKSLSKAEYVQGLIKKVGLMKLPYTYDMAKHNDNSSYAINTQSLDTLLFNDRNGRIEGVLPDTSAFYGFIHYKVGDLFVPFLTTIDKKGNVIDSQGIGIANCGGHLTVDVESCIDNVSINKELKIEMLYKMRGTTEPDTIPPIKICNQIIGKGRITKEGKIEIVKGELENCD